LEPRAGKLLTLSNLILDSLGDGVYVCDKHRRIVYWSKSAERITGWTSEEVVGRRCFENVLCHVDKDGHRLCGEEFCPLHRSMVTGTPSDVPLIVFAQTKDGRRMPTQAFVAPIRDADGMIIGGVETFRDVAASLADLERAKRIQALSLDHHLPKDPRIGFTTLYTPRDVVGGDFFSVRQIDTDHYGFLLADAMGHGVAAALHTMHLSALWSRFHHLLVSPAEFATTLNNELAKVVKDESFATAICGIIDVKKRTFRFSSAGGPPIVVIRPGGSFKQLDSSGFPFGMIEGSEYDEVEAQLCPGDCLLMFSDGAVEVHNAAGEVLGVVGLVRILTGLGYPELAICKEAIEEELLRFSNEIRLGDDVTFIEARLN
jgi:PAS domain S-box-containing protein